jgi:hypothetical protein
MTTKVTGHCPEYSSRKQRLRPLKTGYRLTAHSAAPFRGAALMKTERIARRAPVAEHLPNQGSLLFTRRQTATLLNTSTMTLIRLEARGALLPVRLIPNAKNGKVFYRAADVYALVHGRTDASEH